MEAKLRPRRMVLAFEEEMRTIFTALALIWTFTIVGATEFELGDLRIELPEGWRIEKERKSKLYQAVCYKVYPNDGEAVFELRHHNKRIKRKKKIGGHVFRPPAIYILNEGTIEIDGMIYSTTTYEDYPADPTWFSLRWGKDKDYVTLIGSVSEKEKVVELATELNKHSNKAVLTTPEAAPPTS